MAGAARCWVMWIPNALLFILGYALWRAYERGRLASLPGWLAVIGNALWRRGKAKAATPAEILMKTETLKITGMTCNHCVSTVRRALLEVPGVQAVEVDLAGGTAVVSGEGLDPARLRQAVQGLGYGLKD